MLTPQWDYIAASGGATPHVIFSMGMLRLMRLGLTFRALSEAETEARMPYVYLRFFRFAVMLSLEAHVFACIFYYLSRQEAVSGSANWLDVCAATKPHGELDKMWEQYLFSLYWSVTTLCTLGYGDVTPQTYSEYIMAVSYMIINYCVGAYIIGTLLR